MPKPARRSGRPRLTRFFLAIVLIGLAIAVGVSAWRVRGTLVPDELALAIDRKLRPGRFQARAAWAHQKAIEAVKGLGTAAASWDSTRTGAGLRIVVTLESDIPLEEGNHLVSAALLGTGVEVRDAVEIVLEGGARGAEITYGLEQRAHGSIQIRAPVPEPREQRPRVALILDDLGRQRRALTDAFLALRFPLTVSVLPAEPRSAEIAADAARSGREVLLHLPMEPVGYPQVDPGKGAILVHMSDREIRQLVKRHLDALPQVRGISNHMGSLATQDRHTMAAVLDVVRSDALYFFDSMTTPVSLAGRIAREERIPCIENDLFLDNEQEAPRIRERMTELVRLARARGSAIGIFHPHPICLEVIPAEVARYQAAGIDFVRLSDMDASRWIGGLPGRP